MSAKTRITEATEATAASVRHIRPLSLPEESTAPAGTRERRSRNGTRPRLSGALGRARETWLIPLGAAAVVAGFAVSLVIVRNVDSPVSASGSSSGPVTGAARDSGSAPAPLSAAAAAAAAVAAVPQYFAIATEKIISNIHHGEIDVAVRDVRTGKTVATAVLPSSDQESAVGVSAASDDRTFVVARRAIDGSIVFFQVQFDPAKKAATFRQLPVPAFNPGQMLGFAVSPDGQQLAVLSVRGDGTTLATYSLTSGATLRTWTAAAWLYPGNGAWQAGVSWTADSRQVAFATGGSKSGGALVERVIASTAPNGDLATASKTILTAPGSCVSLLLTPDGGTVVCGTAVNDPPAVPGVGSPGSTAPTSCGPAARPMFVTYSAATGKQLGVLSQYTGACRYAVYSVLWADASARHVVVQTQVEPQPGQSLPDSSQYGVVTGGRFTRLPVPGFDQSSTAPAF